MNTKNLSTDFFENHDHALRMPNIVLRDSLGFLAIQLLTQREDISKLDYDILLCKLHAIIVELHNAYDGRNGNFNF